VAGDESDEADSEVKAPSLPAAGFGLGPSDPKAFDPVAEAPSPFPYGADDSQTAREPDQANATGAMLRYLRQHGNYLTPGEGITLTSVIVVLFRGIILNLLVWIPIVAAVMWFLIWLSVPHVPDAVLRWVPVPVTESARSIYPAQWAPPWLVEFVGNLSPPLERDQEAPASPVEFAGTVSPPMSSVDRAPDSAVEFEGTISPPRGPDDTQSPKLFSFGFMLAAAIFLFVLCVLAFALYSLATWPGHKSSRSFLGGTKYG
jgi:hypothetical protein